MTQMVVNVSGCNYPNCTSYVSSGVEKAIDGADMIIVCLGTGQFVYFITKSFLTYSFFSTYSCFINHI